MKPDGLIMTLDLGESHCVAGAESAGSENFGAEATAVEKSLFDARQSQLF
jgi:hypothetical protein